MELKLFYNKKDKFNMDSIRSFVSREDYKVYSRIIRTITKLEVDLLEAENTKDYNRYEKTQKKLDREKLKERHFRDANGITMAELEDKIGDINRALANNIKIIMPIKYKKLFIQLPILSCKKCGTYKIISKNDVVPMCIKCMSLLE